jgi:hypothetical protein
MTVTMVAPCTEVDQRQHRTRRFVDVIMHHHRQQQHILMIKMQLSIAKNYQAVNVMHRYDWFGMAMQCGITTECLHLVSIKSFDNFNQYICISAADRCCCHSPIPSEMSDISTGAIRFPTFDMNGRLSSANNFDKIANDLTDIRDEFSAIDNDISSLLQRSHCMQDSKHLYRSVVLANSDIASSDIMSVCSGGGAYSDGGSSFGAFRRHTQDMQHNAKGYVYCITCNL